VAQCLSDSKTLGHRLAEQLAIRSGDVYAIAAPQVTEEELYNFDYGDALPQLPREQAFQMPGGGSMLPVVTADALLAHALSARLSQMGLRLIGQYWYSRPDDGWLTGSEDRPWIFGEEVYFTNRSTNPADIVRVIRHANDIWPGALLIVSDFTPFGWHIDHDYQMQNSHIDAIATGTREVFVGVYDAESYLLWTRDPAVVSFYCAAFDGQSF
jgi:hypothetical protein